jgi:hypothetical protein
MSILRSKHSGWAPDGRRTPFTGGGSPPPSQNTTYTTNVPEYARPYVENMLESTQKQIYNEDMTSFRPYQAYGADYDPKTGKQIPGSYDVNRYFAGFQPLQEKAMRSVGQMQTPGQFDQASGLAGAAGLGSLGLAGQAAGAGQQFAQQAQDPRAMQGYMSPYMQNVVDYQKTQALRDFNIAKPMRARQAVGAGAFGGSRQAIMEAEAERSLGSQLQGIAATGSQKAFEDAQRQQQFGAQLGLQGIQAGLQGMGQAGQAAGTLGQLGQQQFGAQKDIINLQSQMGKEQQALEQNKINQAIQDYAISQQYPFMQLGMMNAMLRGLPMQTQSTQLYQAQPSMLQQGIGLTGAASTLFGGSGGRAAGGAIKEYREGGIADAYKYGGAISDPELEAMANKLSAEQLKERLKDPQITPGERQIFSEALNDKSKDKARYAGIAAAGGGLFDTMGYAGGGILAFSNGGMGMTNPEFGGGDQPIDVRKPMTVEELFREYPGLEGKVGLSQIQDYTSGRSAPPESARAKPAPVAASVAAAPKPEAKPPAAKPEGGAPVDRGIAALTGMKSLEEQMREQERLMGPNTGNDELNAKIAKRLADMDKRASQDERAAMRNAFIKFGTEASPGGIGVAALKGIETYGTASDAAKKARESIDLELTKMQADIKKGQRAERRGNLDAAAKSFESAENRKLRLAEMQNQLKVAGISASRPGELEKAFALFQKDPVAFEQFKKVSSLQDDAVKQRANQEAVKTFTSQEFTNFGNDKKYIELKKAAQSGDAAAIKAFDEYRMQKFQNIRNMMLDPEKAIGGGSAATSGAKGQVDTKNPLLGA